MSLIATNFVTLTLILIECNILFTSKLYIYWLNNMPIMITHFKGKCFLNNFSYNFQNFDWYWGELELKHLVCISMYWISALLHAYYKWIKKA